MELTRQPVILLVEDDRPWQTMLTMLCQEAGFHVVQAFDVAAARLYLEGTAPLPDLAIIDLHLRSSSASQQDYDGLQLLSILRDRGIYVVVVSGNIPYVQEALMGRPEIRRLVDKAHFAADADFGSDTFLPWVCEAVAYAQAASHAEGQLPEQQERLYHLAVSLDDHE